MTAVANGARTATKPATAVTVRSFDELEGDLLEQAWSLYEQCFRPLARLAVQRHVMYRHEFNEVMSDKRVGKYLAFDAAGELVGLSPYTNDLYAVPLVSPDYFEAHFPLQYAAQQVWYIVFVAVTEGAPKNTFYELVRVMDGVSALLNGVSVMDFCAYNETVKHIPRATRMMLAQIAAARGAFLARGDKVDSQGYWVFTFGEEPTP